MSHIVDKRQVRISITSERYEVSASLFEYMQQETETETNVPAFLSPTEEQHLGILTDNGKPCKPVCDDAKEEFESYDLYTEGRRTVTRRTDASESVAIAYDESEMTGMAGSTTIITYRRDDPATVTMLRSGAVRTAMTFRAHHRTICTYETPYMPFQVGIHALVVDNRLDTDGVLTLDYVIEIRGARAERCCMTVKVTEDTQCPLSAPTIDSIQ